MITFTLDKLLQARGKSVYWLAQAAGLPQSVVGKIYHNQAKSPRLETLDSICEALDCNLDEIMVRVAKKRGARSS